jgi:hypothetical protein
MVPPLRRDSSSTEASSNSADTVNAVVDIERRQTRQNGSQ